MEAQSEKPETQDRPRIAIAEPSVDQDYNDRSLGYYLRAIEDSGGVPVLVPLRASKAEAAKEISTCAAILLPGSRADVDPARYGQQVSPECHHRDGAREAVDELLLQHAFDLGKPVLAICYGMQSLNVWLNGSLLQDLGTICDSAILGVPEPVADLPGNRHSKSGAAHEISIAADSKLAEILLPASDLETGTLEGHDQPRALWLNVNSSHHQAIATPADSIRVVARSVADGVIEAIERTSGEGRVGAGSSSKSSEPFLLGVQWHPERSFAESHASRLLFQAFVQAASEWQHRRSGIAADGAR